LLQASQLGGPNTWAYDPAQQVTATTNPTGTFSFDPAGNPTTLDGTHQSFNTSGEVCWTGSTSGACGSPPAGATTYGYDANGQRTSGGADTYTYDATGMMTGATTPTSTSSYTYAPDSLRTSKTVGTTSTVFSWDDTTPVPELIQDGNNYYVYGPDGLPVERVGADPTQWLMCDATGSVIGSTDATGSLTSVQSYDPWGNATIHTGSPVSLGWQGQYQDPETHLYYFQHRYYDPTTAQFTTPDPLYALTGSRYGYAGNDPVNGSDPSGLSWFNPCIGDTCASDVGHHAAHTVNNDVVRPAVGVARTSRQLAIDLAAVPPYAVYYASYYGAHAVNSVGCSLGSAGCALAHAISLGFVPAEAVGLGADMAIDAIKPEDWADESCSQSDKRAINPAHSFLPSWLQGPKVYLPGAYRDSQGQPHINFEW
jgi:RHS repeat-associated protein